MLAIFASCKKSKEEVFDKKPEERLSESVAQVKATLLGSSNGWVATLPTQAGGGFAFYMHFDASENVKMYGDLNAASISTQATSTYRLKAVLGTELIFDTFNYISLLVDPVPGVFGGAAGSGFKSDVEFIHVRTNADSIFFKGKKYDQPLVMVKATTAQKASYENNEYKTAIDKLKAYFGSARNPYVEVVSGNSTLKAGIGIDVNSSLASGKRVSLTGVLADGTSTATANAKYAFTLSGADILGSGLVYQGVKFVRIGWKDATTLVFYDSTGKEYVVKSNPTPLTPFHLLFKYNGTYKVIRIGSSLPLGVNSKFNDIYQALAARLAAVTTGGPRTIVAIYITLNNATTATVTISPTNGTSTFLANATFNYTIENDVITLSNPVYDGNWTARGTEYDGIKNYFLSGPFKIDWVTSTNPANTSLMGGLYRVSDPTSFFYGTL